MRMMMVMVVMMMVEMMMTMRATAKATWPALFPDPLDPVRRAWPLSQRGSRLHSAALYRSVQMLK